MLPFYDQDLRFNPADNNKQHLSDSRHDYDKQDCPIIIIIIVHIVIQIRFIPSLNKIPFTIKNKVTGK